MRPSMLAAVIAGALSPVAVHAQGADGYALGGDASEYQQYIVYPHLQRGFRALERREWDIALEAFKRARTHAPRNATTALYLADAYRRSGKPDQAERVLAEQRRYTPGDARLAPAPTAAARAPAAVAPAMSAVGVAPSAQVSSTAISPPSRQVPAAVISPTVLQAEAVSRRATTAALHSHLSASRFAASSAAEEMRWIRLLARASSHSADLLLAYRPRYAEARAVLVEHALPLALEQGDYALAQRLLGMVPSSAYPEARLTVALHTGRGDEGIASAYRLLRRAPTDMALLDRVSYRLAQGGAKNAATRALLDAYPFAGPQQSLLLARLAVLIGDHPERATAADRERLRAPLNGESDRAMQAGLLAALGECDAVRGVMADLSPGYPAPAWVSLAECHRQTDPKLAQYAFAQAVEREGGAGALRALAYQAHSTGDYDQSLQAWRALPIGSMEGLHLLAAATTALDHGDAAQAGEWLDEYDRRGAAGSDGKEAESNYWWLRSRSAGGNAHAERAALLRAIALHEDARYHARLARLQRAAGEHRDAVASLQRAHALDPGDISVEAELAYAHIAAGNDAGAVGHLARYQAAHPADPRPSQDLAEANRRLGRIEPARAAARQAIDAHGHDAHPEQVFRLKRLHEQLGRRWAASADLTLGDSVATAGATIPGSAYRSYAQFEVQYRFGEALGRADRDALSAYARIFAGSGQSGRLWPDDAATLGVGLRWKPLRDEVMYLALEQQIALDSHPGASDDVLVRISAAPLDDPRTGGDWHPEGDAWFAHSLFLDAAHYIRRDETAITVDYQFGFHVKLSDARTLEPFARVQHNAVERGSEFLTDTRAGVGLRFNLWYGGGHYDAYPHRFSVAVEAQQAFDSYLPEKRALFLTFGNAW